MSTSTPSRLSKRQRGNEEGNSPENATPNAATVVPVDICGHCKKRCAETGKKGEAVQCDLCGSWVHAACEGITREHYKSLTQLACYAGNIAYFCNLNLCQSRFKQLFYKLIPSSNEESNSAPPIAMEQEDINDRLKVVEAQLANMVNEISAKLVDHHRALESSLHPQPPSQVVAATSANVAINVADELDDRNRRKCNLIVHNLPEGSQPDKEADKGHLTALCKFINLEVHAVSTIRLGKIIENKTRLLLVRVDDEVIKKKILARSPQLRSNETWKRVFITPDMTRSEREAHKLLRNELKTRRSQGETNLTIRGNRIISVTMSHKSSVPFPSTIAAPTDDATTALTRPIPPSITAVTAMDSAGSTTSPITLETNNIS